LFNTTRNSSMSMKDSQAYCDRASLAQLLNHDDMASVTDEPSKNP